ncbi:MAG: Crp/Fnr family transcriptional regulator [Clostridia bacterium]|nr:Crp/Fnr family transcriptional regulator [Clostridia bacterium]
MKIKAIIPQLKNHPLFCDFSEDDLLSLFQINNYSLYTYGKNQIIHFEGEICTTLDILLVGQVIIQRIDENGNILTITNFDAGESLGANLLFGKHHAYPMTVVSQAETIILSLKKDFILLLCQTNQNFLNEFLKCISDKTFILTKKIKSISFQSLRQSIIDYLIYQYHVQNNPKIHLSMSKKDLAERFGVQRTSLSRELSKMRQEGLIQFDAGSITILDMELLNRGYLPV